MQKTGFLERSPGNKSMMRLALLIAIIVSSIVALWGMFEIHLVIRAVIGGESAAVALLGTLGLLVGGALGVIAGSEGLKALQQRGEAKESGHIAAK